MRLTPRADLSLEFLMGRTLDNAMLNVGLKKVAKGVSNPWDLRSMLLTRAIRWSGRAGFPHRRCHKPRTRRGLGERRPRTIGGLLP